MRRFAALIEGLPFETAATWQTERAERKTQDGGWTFSDHLAALQIETTHMVYRAVLASIPSPRPRKLPEPLQIPRPGDKRRGPRRVTPLELIESLRR